MKIDIIIFKFQYRTLFYLPQMNADEHKFFTVVVKNPKKMAKNSTFVQ